MPLSFTADKESSIVHLLADKEADDEQYQQVMSEFMAKLSEMESPRILIEYIPESDSSNPRIFQDIWTVAQAIRHRTDRIAVVTSQDGKNNMDYFVEILNNPNCKAKIFSDSNAGLEWLKLR